MTTAPRPIPCGECDAFLASSSDQFRDGFGLVRRYFDHQARLDGQPHRHVGSARAEDLEAFDRVLQQELADRRQVDHLLSTIVNIALLSLDEDETVDEWLARCTAAGDAATVHGVAQLLAEALRIEETRTNYLGGPPALARLVRGT
jgi:hypothetical protein